MMLYQETSRSGQNWSLQTLGYEYYDDAEAAVSKTYLIVFAY